MTITGGDGTSFVHPDGDTGEVGVIPPGHPLANPGRGMTYFDGTNYVQPAPPALGPLTESRHAHPIEPGQKCPTCDRRVNHPKKADSPASEVDSFRVPAGEKTLSREVEETAARHAGINVEAPYWRYRYRVGLDAFVLQQEPGFLARAIETGA